MYVNKNNTDNIKRRVMIILFKFVEFGTFFDLIFI